MTSGEYATDPPPDRLRALLRANYRAALVYDGRIAQRKYVLDARGRPAMPLTPFMLHADETVLFIPNEGPDALEMLVEPTETTAQGRDADRWRIYHGDIRESRFAFFTVASGRFAGEVFDGEVIVASDPLRHIEPGICREMNAPDRRGDLRTVCRFVAGVDVENPRLIGIDCHGMDIRAGFGIMRAPWDQAVTSERGLRRALADMLESARRAEEE